MEIKKQLNALLEKIPFIDLATVNGDGIPEVRNMLNLRNPGICTHLKGRFNAEDFTLFFTTTAHSPKMKQIAANDKASVYVVDPNTMEAALFLGKVSEVKDKKLKDSFWHDSWKMYYPKGRDGGEFIMLGFKPEKYKFYDGKFNTLEGGL